MKFIFCLGLVSSMDGQKTIHHFPTLVYTEAVYTFVEKNDVMLCYWMTGYVVVVFYKKMPKKFYGANLIFWSFATFFGLTIFDQCQTKILLQ